MKIAAGCFGCLALVFFALTLLTGTILSAIAAADPGLAADLAPVTAYAQYINGGCCCFSGFLAIVLLAVGMSRGNNEAVE